MDRYNTLLILNELSNLWARANVGELSVSFTFFCRCHIREASRICPGIIVSSEIGVAYIWKHDWDGMDWILHTSDQNYVTVNEPRVVLNISIVKQEARALVAKCQNLFEEKGAQGLLPEQHLRFPELKLEPGAYPCPNAYVVP